MKGQLGGSIRVFCGYAHEDEVLRNELEKHLAPMRKSGRITTWYDYKILPGMDWRNEIISNLDSAHIILLLISSDFLNSDICYEIMQRAIERQKAGEAHVVPIILRPVSLESTPLETLQVLPSSRNPVISWRNKDEALLDVVKGISRVVVVFSSSVDTKIGEEKFSVDAVRKLLQICYRRAIFTKTHNEIGWEAMFASLDECRSSLQRNFMSITSETAQQLVARIIGELDFIERFKSRKWGDDDVVCVIDAAKLSIIQALSQLAKLSQIPFVLPTSLSHDVFWTKEDADNFPVHLEEWK